MKTGFMNYISIIFYKDLPRSWVKAKKKNPLRNELNDSGKDAMTDPKGCNDKFIGN